MLHFDCCPNGKVADKRLTEALRILRRDDAVIEHHRVNTPEQAEELKFLGSPTIRIDGPDPFATGAEQVDLVCRVCATPYGLGGSPATAQLLAVLR